MPSKRKIDVKFWIPLILLILNLFGIITTKFNDIKHMSKDLEIIVIKVNGLDKRVANMEGQLERIE